MRAGSLAGFPAPDGVDLPQPANLLALLARVEAVSQPWSRFAHALMADGILSPQWRELVVLRVGWRQHCDYVLSGHLPVARHAGLSEDQIAAALGQPGTETSDLPLLASVDELLSLGRISEATLGQLKELLSDEEIIELTVLAGQYVLVSMVCKTFALRSEASSRQVGPHRAP